MITALVPLKDLVMAKTRLSGLLSPSERRALAQAMAEDVLSVLAAHQRIDRTVLVSDDPAAELLTAQYGMEAWSEASLGVRGLNNVLQIACGRVAESGGGVTLILHADLPLLDGSDIDNVLDEQSRTGGLVIGTDHDNAGSNLLAFDAAKPPRFKFGVNSCPLHEADAVQRQVPVTVMRSVGISTDVDEVKDLRTYVHHAASGAERKTAIFLRSSPIESRLSVTCAEGVMADTRPASGEVSGGSSNKTAYNRAGCMSRGRIDGACHAQSGSGKETGKSG